VSPESDASVTQLFRRGQTTPEAELIARLRRAELAALAEAYDAHHVHVRAFAQRLLGDDAAAEDLVQDTFLALPQATKGFAGNPRSDPF